jgi:hypothetical protein
MSGSRLASQYSALVAMRQFAVAAELVRYVAKSTDTTHSLQAVVERQQSQANEHRSDGEYEIYRATLSVFAVVDAVCGGVVLTTVDDLKAFKGTKFEVSAYDGGPLMPDWRVESITGGPGTWELGVVREKRVDLGNARKGKD